MGIPEAIEELGDADPKEFAETLKEERNDHYNAVFKEGYGAAKGDMSRKLDKKKAEVEDLQSQIQAKEEEIEALQASADDGDHQQRITELESRNQELKGQLEQAKAEVSTTAKGFHKRALEEQVVSKLIEIGVEADYAREVLAPKVRRRIDVAQREADDGVQYEPRFMDEDGVTPVQAQNGNLAHVAAEKVKGNVDSKWLTSSADKGGGSSSQNGSAAGGYDPVKAGKEMAQKQKASDNSELAFS